MKLAPSGTALQLPDSLRTQLLEFRRRMWTVKLLEAVAGAVCGVSICFFALFVGDRLFDSPHSMRLTLWMAAVLLGALVPRALYRWVWQQRTPEQLARQLARQLPSVGHQLLGIIELAQNDREQARSFTLCQAAIVQVAEQARQCDLAHAVPLVCVRRRITGAAVCLAGSLALLAVFPSASVNAWQRLLVPWGDIPRYTFVAIEPLPAPLVVPHGEAFTLSVELTNNSAWRPAYAAARLTGQQPVRTHGNNGCYRFDLPAQFDPVPLTVTLGDLITRTTVEPLRRPELADVVGTVWLPEYLGRPQPFTQDVRGGAISLVRGSCAKFVATATRPLASATVDGQAVQPLHQAIAAPPVTIDESRTLRFEWVDQFGLAGPNAFSLSISAVDDQPPAVASDDLPHQRVLLDSETLRFTVRARDDFGLKQVGMEWHGIESPHVHQLAHGERLLGAGGPNQSVLELAGAFTASSLDIAPQSVRLRLFVEDFFPGRQRVYSPAVVLHVLNAQQHAQWLAAQMNRWYRQALDVRDRELALHETNQDLHQQSANELDRPDTRQHIAAQAAAERSNSHRLSQLVLAGEDLWRQALRNPDIGADHLEQWAEMLHILTDISAQRMPSVANLLQQSAQTVGHSPLAATALQEAVRQQHDLLAEFEKVADAWHNTLANLEGSTLARRLKAASRQQLALAQRLVAQLDATFGQPLAARRDPYATVFHDIASDMVRSSEEVSNIMADLQAYWERRRLVPVQAVLRDMRQHNVVGGLRQLGDDLPRESGLSIAQCEFWADLLDRWADDLMEACKEGPTSNGPSNADLPTSLVLEVLQILDGEVHLREETRIAEQAKSAVRPSDHAAQAAQLSTRQVSLQQRLDHVIQRLRDLPDSEHHFSGEIADLSVVSQVMREAADILAQPNTGAPAIAAETEAIELLLRSQRANSRSGTGGGDTPGGGGGGNTAHAALLHLGTGIDANAVRTNRGTAQATGKAELNLPEEFRAGLDEYFNRLENTAMGDAP